MKYRPEVDGLRAVAVVPVIFFHAGLPLLSGGFLGVDVFFVISGYLITTILLEELRRPSRDGGFFGFVAGFYERRARRILPALFVVLAATTLFAFGWMDRTAFQDYARSLQAVVLFYSNLHFAATLDYFSGPVDETALIHTWSLAVEEQFYLLFPPVLYLLRWMEVKRLGWLFAVLALGSLVWAEAMQRGLVGGVFYLPQARAFELLAGAVCAVIRMERPDQSDGVLAAVGLAMIVLAMLVLDEGMPLPGIATLLPVLGTALVILYAGGKTVAGRLLGIRPVVAVGLVSYSAYLWHQPIFALARIHSLEAPGRAVMAALIVLTFGFAALTWLWVEQPVRQMRGLWAGRRAILVSACVAMVGATGYSRYSMRADSFADHFRAPELGEYVADNKSLQLASWSRLKALAGGNYAVGNNAFDRTLWFNDPARDDIVLFGNSHGKDLFNALSQSPYAKRYEFARFGSARLDADRIAQLRASPNYHEAEIVMLATRYQPEDVEAVPDLVRMIRADGKRAVIVLNTVEFPGSKNGTLTDKIIARAGALTEADWPDLVARIDRAHFERADPDGSVAPLNQRLREIATELDVTVLDRAEYQCDAAAQSCFAIGPQLAKYFYDYGHTTTDGAAFFAQRIGALQWLDPAVENKVAP